MERFVVFVATTVIYIATFNFCVLFCRCSYAYYCGQKCMEEDLPNHKGECFYLGRTRGTGGPSSDTVRFALRVVLTMCSPESNQLCDIVPGQKGLCR